MNNNVESKGKEIFSLIDKNNSKLQPIFSKIMKNEQLKTQLFRFVEVLPYLNSSKEINKHIKEYLGYKTLPWITSFIARKSVAYVGQTFILASDPIKAIPKIECLRQIPIAFTADILGETVVSEKEADEYQKKYINLIESLSSVSDSWKHIKQIDNNSPKVNVSIKMSSLYSQIHPEAPDKAVEHIFCRLYPILKKAIEKNVFVNFDMESFALKDLIIKLFKKSVSYPEFNCYPFFGIAIQAYLKSAENDLKNLIKWSEQNNYQITVRLIKGAYWDYETIIAKQKGWPIPVFEKKWKTDVNYEKLTIKLLKSNIKCAFGTHNIRSIARSLVEAEKLKLPLDSFEFQMLYGMAQPIKKALIKMGCCVRDYCPIGEILPGMSYLIRRLLENTSNEGFLRSAFIDNVDVENLLKDPLCL